MISFYNIWAIARIEIRTLLRSWFFRIFSIIAIVFLGFFNFAALSPITFSPWPMRGISSATPYVTILFLNSVQAIIAVFLASDFLKRDKKLDTTEVVYMRSMTNGDYIAGKTVGILTVFFFLNLTTLLVALIFQLVFTDVAFIWESYFLYPLLISLPTLVYILGLSFLLMVLIRNQAVTFIVLLGYIATTLFYLGRKLYHLFDYMSFNVPFFYSGITGFVDIRYLLIHRCIYLALGLSCIFLTILMIKRLPQSRTANRISLLLAIIFMVAAVLLGVTHVNDLKKGADIRREMVTLGDESISDPALTTLACSIDLAHTGEGIEAEAFIRVRNDNEDTVGTYIFRLNPSLRIDRISSGGKALDFTRRLHMLWISPAEPLATGMTDSFTVSYTGSIDDRACYPDIDEETREQEHRMEQSPWFNVGKRYSFVNPDYLLLTPENLWYPVAGAGYSAMHPEISRKDFIDFSLNVTTGPGLEAVSQGKSEKPADGRFSFRPEFPLPSLTLAIGEYDYYSVSIDSVEYRLCFKKGHDFFSKYFTEIGDTLSSLITEMREDTESKLGLDYPYRRLLIVETPIQFFSYRHLWSVAQETVQPEMVLLPEMALPIRRVDFRRMKRFMERRQDRTNETTSEIENQCNLFKSFISSTITESSGFFSFRDDADPFTLSPSYNIFPNFLTFTNNIVSDDFPILSVALEAFYSGKLVSDNASFMRSFSGMSPDERINAALEDHTLQEILADPEQRALAHFAIKGKGDYFFQYLEKILGEKGFEEFLTGYLKDTRFRSVTGSHFLEQIRARFNFDFQPYIEQWYTGRQLPGYIVGDFDAYKVLDGDRERYQVKLKISNPEPVPGLVKITFRRRMGPGRGGGFRRRFGFGGPEEEDQEELVLLGAEQTIRLGYILDYQPGQMEINTLISKNIPSLLNITIPDFELKKKAVPFSGEEITSDPVSLAADGEIIVDNEDPGFEVQESQSKSWLKRMFAVKKTDDATEYVGMNWHSSPWWSPTTDTKFFGKYVRSARFTDIGDGKRKASWKTEIAESGYYDVYCHISRIRPFFRRRNEEYDYGSNHYRVYHDDGVEETEIDLNTAEDGWNFLGSYYISTGTARIEITNKAEKGRYIIADAVKWIKR